MNQNDDLERELRALAPPPAPAGLRGDVLAAARAALRRESAPDLWTRLWESAPLRLAWSLALVLLVVAHVALPQKPREEMARRADDEDREVARLARLPELDTRTLPTVEPSIVKKENPS